MVAVDEFNSFDFLTILFLGKYMDRPLHFFGSLGSISVLLGVMTEIYILYLKYVLFDLLSLLLNYLFLFFLIWSSQNFLASSRSVILDLDNF